MKQVDSKHQFDQFSLAILKGDSDHLEGVLKQSSLDRSKIYHRQYIFNLLDPLELAFPTIVSVLDEQNFRYFGRQFILMGSGSQSPDIYRFLDGFPDFLKTLDMLPEHEIISQLAAIDLLLFREKPGVYITCFRGLLDLWASYQDEDSSFEGEIDDEQFELIEVTLEPELELKATEVD